MYNSIENRHPWQTTRVMVKGSDRIPFILDWILVYTSSTMWIDLSTYLNLWKEEKLKSQSNLRISQKDFYSVYLTHPSCNKWWWCMGSTPPHLHLLAALRHYDMTSSRPLYTLHYVIQKCDWLLSLCNTSFTIRNLWYVICHAYG